MGDPAAEDAARIGRGIGEKYSVQRLIGAGGMGAVYVAENTWTGRRVAVKVMRPEFAANDAAVRRFMLEARTATQIAHPNIVEILDMGRDADGSLYIVQELLIGVDLRAYLDEHDRLRAVEALNIIVPIMGALVAAHKRGIVHRDIKPENIFLQRDSSGEFAPKIIDFGISKIVDKEGPGLSNTGTGVAIGTPYYMSPEQARGEADLDGRSDVWSVGAVLYEMLAGRTPFHTDNYNLLIVAILTEVVPRIDAVVSDVPTDIAEIVHKALERDRDKRHGSMRSFLSAILESPTANGASARLEDRHKRSIPNLAEATGKFVLPGHSPPAVGARPPRPGGPANANVPTADGSPMTNAATLPAGKRAMETLAAGKSPAKPSPPAPEPESKLPSLFDTSGDLDDVETRVAEGSGPKMEPTFRVPKPTPGAMPAVVTPPGVSPVLAPALVVGSPATPVAYGTLPFGGAANPATSSVPFDPPQVPHAGSVAENLAPLGTPAATGTHSTPLQWTAAAGAAPARRSRGLLFAGGGAIVLVAIVAIMLGLSTSRTPPRSTVAPPPAAPPAAPMPQLAPMPVPVPPVARTLPMPVVVAPPPIAVPPTPLPRIATSPAVPTRSPEGHRSSRTPGGLSSPRTNAPPAGTTSRPRRGGGNLLTPVGGYP